MDFLMDLLRVLDADMETPTLYGWFHILWLALTVGGIWCLCHFFKQGTEKQVRGTLLTIALTVIVLEIYKQINYTFCVENGTIVTDYQWYAFPFQFCSIPMYVGLLAALLKPCKVRDALDAFLASYSIFAGVCVMLYPGDVFVRTIGIDIQTMICHSSMIVQGVYLLYVKAVRVEHKTILKAVPVFSIAVCIAVVLNEIAFYSGLLENEVFNMFFVSRHCDPSLPVYSLVQQVVPYPWSLIIYIVMFSLAAYVMLLIAMLVKHIAGKRKVAPATAVQEEKELQEIT